MVCLSWLQPRWPPPLWASTTCNLATFLYQTIVRTASLQYNGTFFDAEEGTARRQRAECHRTQVAEHYWRVGWSIPEGRDPAAPAAVRWCLLLGVGSRLHRRPHLDNESCCRPVRGLVLSPLVSVSHIRLGLRKFASLHVQSRVEARARCDGLRPRSRRLRAEDVTVFCVSTWGMNRMQVTLETPPRMHDKVSATNYAQHFVLAPGRGYFL